MPPDPKAASYTFKKGFAQATGEFAQTVAINGPTVKCKCKCDDKKKTSMSCSITLHLHIFIEENLKRPGPKNRLLEGIYGHEQRHVQALYDQVQLVKADLEKEEKNVDPNQLERGCQEKADKVAQGKQDILDQEIQKNIDHAHDKNPSIPKKGEPYEPLGGWGSIPDETTPGPDWDPPKKNQ